jgi:ATP-dependent Clp protease, protease subunit
LRDYALREARIRGIMETIYIIGEINEERFKQFDIKLTRFEKEIKKVRVVLSSDGGSAIDAISFYDRIKQSELYITIEAYGIVASAAVLVLAAGDTRRLGKNAWVMVHEDVTDVTKHNRVTEAEKIVEHNRRLEDQWNTILEQSTTTTREEWAELHKNETYLTADECLEYGLVDEVL